MKHLSMMKGALAGLAMLMLPQAALAKTVTLDVITQNGKFYQAVADAYVESGTKNKVLLQAPSENYDDVAQRALRAAMIGDPPDVVFMGYNRMQLTVDREIAVALDGIVGSEQELENLGYLPSVLDMCRCDGKLYGLPFATSIPIIFYNPELVKQAGGDPDNFPGNWDDLFALARKIDALDDQTMGLFFRYIHSGNWSWQALIQSFGGSIMTEDGKAIAFDSAAGKAALDILYRMKDAGMVDMSTNQARQAFMSGTVGIFFDSSSALKKVQNGSTFHTRTAQYPSPVTESRLPGGGNCAVMTTPDPERQAAALDFMKFATSPQGQTVLVNATGYVSTNTLANSNPAYLGNFYDENPEARTAADALPRLASWRAFPGDHSVEIVQIIRTYLEAVINHTQTPDEALKGMVADVEPLLPKN